MLLTTEMTAFTHLRSLVACLVLVAACHRQRTILPADGARTVDEQRGGRLIVHGNFGEEDLGASTSDAAVRLTMSQSFGGTSVHRLVYRGGNWTYVIKGRGFGTDRELVTADSTEVPATLADSVVNVIRAANFWEGAAGCRDGGIDGQSHTLEVWLDGRRRFKRCWMSGMSPYPSGVQATQQVFAWMASQVPALDRPRAP